MLINKQNRLVLTLREVWNRYESPKGILSTSRAWTREQKLSSKWQPPQLLPHTPTNRAKAKIRIHRCLTCVRYLRILFWLLLSVGMESIREGRAFAHFKIRIFHFASHGWLMSFSFIAKSMRIHVLLGNLSSASLLHDEIRYFWAFVKVLSTDGCQLILFMKAIIDWLALNSLWL